MGSEEERELYFVFMNYDPEYDRLRSKRTKRGGHGNELDLYLSRKHDELLATTLEPGSYKKTLSLVIVDGFAVQITDDQVLYLIANVLRSAKGVRVVEKNQEIA
ncbi:subtilisin-like protease SBT2.5 isoform X2 [Rhododendron vialii]|uniref:subtilisin-like protease SBT2.5 isoform X2 n=1 Tax=Rhododendron vialii TaxID=182163 RepID=UPI00265EAF48|nr:subtilisin-like protease SBT2.5 isoform X2 [Rhododendron vialii]